MGKYSVPEEIRKLKPKGTMVKNISGYFYVYEFSNYTDENGKRHTKMGKIIGSIKKGIGFVPNNNFNRKEEITSLDFGEYAITLANSSKTLGWLNDCFNPQDAATIYVMALLHFVNGFTYLKDIKSYFEMSALSLRFPTLKLGYESLGKLLDSLGRRQNNVLKFEQMLLSECSREIAIDGHVIGCKSTENDLAEKGYKFSKLGEEQINLLMAYDVNTYMPLISRIYEGASPDSFSVKDLMKQVELKDMLFIVDRGFYCAENLKLFSTNGNNYIIPLGKCLRTCKKAVSNLELKEGFMYQSGTKASVVNYKDEVIDGVRVITYRDMNQFIAEQKNYLRHMSLGGKSFTKESFEENVRYMGVTVLQTSLGEGRSAEEVYDLYKKRWAIETFYNYFKNKAGYVSLYQEDYYKTQGLSFVMLVSALIRYEMTLAAKNVEGMSVQDCLLTAKMVKIHKRNSVWYICNMLKKQRDLFSVLNTPALVEF